MLRETLFAAGVVALAVPSAHAETPRELLTIAAFQTTTKSKALALIQQAMEQADRTLATRPGDREAALQRGVAIGYRAKLTRNRSDARTSLAIFQGLAAQNPNDPEAQMVLAGWHLDAINQLGSLVARTGLGARAQVGEAALRRGVSLGGNRAFYLGLGALMKIRLDPSAVAEAKGWAQSASTGDAPTPLDAQMKRAAIAILPALRANDGKGAAALASKLLPFGKLQN